MHSFEHRKKKQWNKFRSKEGLAVTQVLPFLRYGVKLETQIRVIANHPDQGFYSYIRSPHIIECRETRGEGNGR